MNDRKLTPRERRLKLAAVFTKKVATKGARRIKSRGQKDDGLWFGLGVFGVVGWSVAIPTLIGTAIGLWIDRTWPSRFSWALMLLILGVGLGCINAWYWMKKARDNIIEK
jgi:ATP synthase protein I